jgi:hypothetical protein
VIRYGQYGRKVSWNVKWYRQYGRKPSWLVKRYGQYGRKASWIVKRYEKCENTNYHTITGTTDPQQFYQYQQKHHDILRWKSNPGFGQPYKNMYMRS